MCVWGGGGGGGGGGCTVQVVSIEFTACDVISQFLYK